MQPDDLMDYVKTKIKKEEKGKYYCEMCTARVGSYNSKLTHAKDHVSQDLGGQFQCSICNKKFFRNFILKRHIKNVHNVN